MTLQPNSEKSPPEATLHVETSTKSTTDTSSPKTMPLEAPNSDVASEMPQEVQPQHEQHDEKKEVTPMVVVTEGGPSDFTKAGEGEHAESGSVVSMPAAVPNTITTDGASSSPIATPQESDGGSVASAPAVVVDVDGGIGSSEIEDIMASPHGNNAIVERSPGGRYVRFMEKLGSGASKDVYRAYDTQEGIEVAWNVVHLAGVPKNERNRIVNEVRLLERLHHHNIISFHGSWVNREKQQVNFVTEILSSGTLKSFIDKVQVIRWKIAKRWALQILQGLVYLHSQDPPVIHRDLKCENIFINGTSGDLRIGDLGLSTVHRNGKALSVLGTPEFMAPDMYEESAYDEKVDIYAFGMCLLEIFTKEIPYRECNNPAQIYKKVIRGDPPDSLKRLKSRHARDFINLCLGTKDENGVYLRPSATELIDHPFLQLRPSDDDEVEVEPPMQERTIKEVPETSSSGAKIAKKPAAKTGKGSPQNKPRNQSTNSLEEIGPHTFEEMPDSETAFRQPTVLVGRGQELQRDEEPIPVSASQEVGEGQAAGTNDGVDQAKKVSPITTKATLNQTNPPNATSPASEQNDSPPEQVQKQTRASSFHFLVAAAVIEDEFSNTRPYEDDILKLVVTLPVEGQTQNVQFDFHLVEDDAIQVAKEMVAELGIPQAAVLEISETISGLARAARVKQDKFYARMNKAHHQRSRSVSQSQNEMLPPQQQSIGHAPSMVQAKTHPPLQEYMNMPPPVQSQQQHQGQQSMNQQGQPMGQQHASTSSLPPMNPQIQSQPVKYMGQADQSIQTAPAHMTHNQQQQQPQQSWSNNPQGNPPVQPPAPNQDPNYGHAPIVRSVSTGNQMEAPAPAPAYNGQMPLQQQQQLQGQVQSVQAQQQGQNQDGQGVYGQVPVQQQQHQTSNVPSSYGQPQVQHHRQQPQVQNGGQPSMDSQNPYNQSHSAQQHGQMLNQQVQPQHAQNQMMQQPKHAMQNQVQGPGGHITTQSSYDYPQQNNIPAQEHQNMSHPPPHSNQGQGDSAQVSQAYHPPPQEQQGQEQYMQQSQPYPPSQNLGQQQQQQQQIHHPPGQQMQRLSITSQNQGYGQPPQQVPPPQQQLQHNQAQPFMQQQQQPSPPAQGMPQLQAGQSQQQHIPQHPQELAGAQQQGAPQTAEAQQQQLQPIPSTVEIQDESQPQLRTVVGDEGAVNNAEQNVFARQSSSSISEDAAAAIVSTDPIDIEYMNGVHGVPSMDIEDDDLNDDKLALELRKLDEDFQKTMARAQKVFDSRMDNLSRTQVQREAQHKKTLEKHQKERADFEKRRQQEEIEQNRRIEQLQKDWEKRRDAMRQKKQMEEALAAAGQQVASSSVDGSTDGDAKGSV